MHLVSCTPAAVGLRQSCTVLCRGFTWHRADTAGQGLVLVLLPLHRAVGQVEDSWGWDGQCTVPASCHPQRGSWDALTKCSEEPHAGYRHPRRSVCSGDKPKAFPVQFKAERLPFKITAESKTFAFASLKGCVLLLLFSFTLKALPSSQAV